MPEEKTPTRRRRSVPFTVTELEKTPKSAKKAPKTPKSMQKSTGKAKTPITTRDKAKSPSVKKSETLEFEITSFKTPKLKILEKIATPKKKTPKKGLIIAPTALKTPESERKTSTLEKTEESPIKIAKSPKKVKKITPKKIIDKNPPTTLSSILDDDVEGKEEDLNTLESKYNVKIEDVENGIEGVIKLTKNDPKYQQQVFKEQFPLLLQVNAIKVQKKFSKILRIPLNNSILTPDSDICLIVPDVKGIPNKEHEKHLEHYHKILWKANIHENIKKIMTFHEFRTEYETFELKKRLVELYDFFLVDGRISGKVVKKCGKIFYKKRKIPTPIKLQASKLKEQFERTLSKTLMFVHSKGDSYSVQFGHSDMSVEDLTENVYNVLEGLDRDFPGGLANVRNIGIFTNQSMVIPVYTTLKNQNEVKLSTACRNQLDYLEYDLKEADL